MKKRILIALCLFACLFGMTGCADILNSIPPSAEEVEKFLDDWNATKSAVTSTSNLISYDRYEEFAYSDGNVLKANEANGEKTRIADYNFEGKTYEIKMAGEDILINGSAPTGAHDALIANYLAWLDKETPVLSYSKSITRNFNGYHFTVKDVYTEDGRETTSIDFRGPRRYSFEISGYLISNELNYDSVKINGRTLNYDQIGKWEYKIEDVTTTIWSIL